MNQSPPKEQRQNALLLILALGGISTGLAGAFGTLALALVAIARGDNEAALGTLWWAAGSLVIGLSGLPLAYWAGRGLVGLPAAGPARPRRAWAWLALLFPAAIGIGQLAFDQKVAPQVLAPTAQILAAGVPVALLALMARRLAPPVTERRAWAQFLLGAWVTPAFALAVEVLVLIPMGMLVAVGLMLTPQGNDFIRLLTETPNLTIEQLSPADLLLGQPWLVALLLLFAAVLVPVIEEAFKTIAIWPFLPRSIRPAEAFLGGLLCGSGYALFEALFIPQPGSEWSITMVSRIGTTLVHAFGAGIASAGLARAAATRRLLPALPPYLGAVALHGLWNATAIGMGIGLLVVQDVANESVRRVVEPLATTVGPLVLVLLGLGALAGIVLVAVRLRPSDGEPGAEPARYSVPHV